MLAVLRKLSVASLTFCVILLLLLMALVLVLIVRLCNDQTCAARALIMSLVIKKKITDRLARMFSCVPRTSLYFIICRGFSTDGH